MYVRQLKYIILVGVLLLNGCGGGGGSNESSTSSSETTVTAATFTTQEYNNRWDLAAINAAQAFARDPTPSKLGSGITVAVIDDGLYLDHNEFINTHDTTATVTLTDYDGGNATLAPNTFSQASKPFYKASWWNNDNVRTRRIIPLAGEETAHGTFTSGTITSGRNCTQTSCNQTARNGMLGLAPSSTILFMSMPFSYLDTNQNIISPNFDYNSDQKDIFQYIKNNHVKIVNRSYGSEGMINEAGHNNQYYLQYYNNYLSDIRDFIRNNQDMIFVTSAGNEGTNQVSYEAGMSYYYSDIDNIIAVVSTNANGSIASFSQKCGVAKAFCIAAPGSLIMLPGTESASEYMYASGTSFSAPTVSGAIALIQDVFSSSGYTAKQAAVRILNTANNTGIYADSDTYGVGLLDLNAATSPQGRLTVANHTTIDLPKHTVAYTLMEKKQVHAPLPAKISKNKHLEQSDHIYDIPMKNIVKMEVHAHGYTNNNIKAQSSAVRWQEKGSQPILFRKSSTGYAFGDAFKRGLQGKTIMLFDTYDAGFIFDFDHLQGQIIEAKSLDNRLQILQGDYIQTTYWPWRSEVLWVGNLLDDVTIDSVMEAKLIRRLKNTNHFIFGSFATNPVRNHFLDGDYELAKLYVDGQAFVPYWPGVSENAFAIGGWSQRPNNQVRISAFAGPLSFNNNDNTSIYRMGSNLPWQSYIADDKNYGLLADWSIVHKQSISSSVISGYINESQTIFGGTPSQVLDFTKGGKTAFIGFGLQSILRELWTVTTSGYLGFTDPNESANGLTRIDKIKSSQFDIGFEKKAMFQEGDTMTLRIGQPLKIESGSITIQAAQSVNEDKEIQYTIFDTSLVPSATTMHYDLGYNLIWDEKTDEGNAKWLLRIQTSYLRHPEHSQDTKNTWTHMASIKWWFKER
ncbi:MAG: S8 family peptidase [Pseudomonadota bacterium]|nr:S8 family peptidase [Pseudomonadota bacterium]